MSSTTDDTDIADQFSLAPTALNSLACLGQLAETGKSLSIAELFAQKMRVYSC